MRRFLSASLLQVTHPRLWRHYSEMLGTQWLPRGDVEAVRDERLTAALRHAVAFVPRYRDLAVREGWGPDDVTHETLTRFPLVDKRIMTSEQPSFLAEDVPASARVADRTGGSTGIVFNFYYDKRFKEIRRGGDFFSRALAGWRPGDPVAVIWGHLGDLASTRTFKARVADGLLYRRITLNAYEITAQRLAAYTERLRAHRPRLIIGYASSLALLAEYLERRHDASIRPAGIISSAETLSDDQRAVIERVFGCRVFNRYGSREFANVAQQCECGAGLHVFADRIHVEILRPDGSPCGPGERGEIVVTDFINRVMPFIRYRTGDVGVVAGGDCPCGRGLPILAAVEGRTSEVIVGRNGRYISCPGPRLYGADIPGLVQMQLIQDSRDDLEVKVVAGPAWGDESRKRLIGRMHELLGDINVDVNIVDHIPPAPSGKYRFTISRVSPFEDGGKAG